MDTGSSFLPAEINAAFLWAQLESLDMIQTKRKSLWKTYWNRLKPLADQGRFMLPDMPDYATNNAHMFYLVCNSLSDTGEYVFLELGIIFIKRGLDYEQGKRY